jgi:hypothetical protein
MSKPAVGVERFIIRAHHEWAFVYIDETTGVFACYSSFGSYNYCWTHIGTRTLKEFLLDLDFDYFMGKTRGLAYKQFSADATLTGIKEYIIEGRRDGWISKEVARTAWEEAVDLQSSHDFFGEFCASKVLMGIYGGDYCGVAREALTGNAKGFWEKIWPALLIQLRDALKHQI